MGQESVKLLLARRPPEVFQIPLRKGFMPATVHGNPPDSIVMARPLAGLPSTTSPTSRTAVQWSLPPEHHAERGNRGVTQTEAGRAQRSPSPASGMTQQAPGAGVIRSAPDSAVTSHITLRCAKGFPPEGLRGRPVRSRDRRSSNCQCHGRSHARRPRRGPEKSSSYFRYSLTDSL